MTSSPAAAAAPADAPAAAWVPTMLGLALIWGSSFLFIKVAVAELHPTYVTLGRVALGALALLGFLAVTGQRLSGDRRFWAHNLVTATVGTAAPFTLFAYGEQRVSSVLAGIWNATTPLVVLPLAVGVFGTERWSRRKLAGLALGFLGALVILGVWRGVGGASLSGQLMCFAAAACYGLAIPYQKRFLVGRSTPGVVIATAQLLLATAVMAVVAPLVSGSWPDVAGLSLPATGSLVVLGAVGTGLAFVLHFRNIRLVGASVASMVTYVIPVFATVLGVLVLREDLAWYQPVGAAIVLLGVAVSQGLVRRVGPGRRSGTAVPGGEPATVADDEGDRAVGPAGPGAGPGLQPGLGQRAHDGRPG